jgi:hypothetical protein
MMRKLSTWLVVALTGGAFALGLTGGAFLSGGAHRNNFASNPSPPAGTGSVALPRTPTHAAAGQKAALPSTRTPPGNTPKALVRTVTTPAVDTPVAVTTPNKTVIVRVPEPNPVAAATPTAVPVAVGAPAPPPAPPAAAPAPPAPAPSNPNAPSKTESSALRAMAHGGVNLLAEAAAEGGATTAPLKIVQELEKCLELVAASSLPGGLEAPPCEIK